MIRERTPTQTEAEALARALTSPGPVTLRAKDRDALMQTLSTRHGVVSRAGKLSPWAVHLDVHSRADYGGSVWNLPAWREGLCEVQDEGSQCIALACEALRGDAVLDFCAGNGGKTLALATVVGPSGSVLAHDIVPSRLAALRANAQRAGIAAVVRTVATAPADGTADESTSPDVIASELAPLIDASRTLAPQGHDVVLVDATCSSCGMLRRHVRSDDELETFACCNRGSHLMLN